MTDTKFLPIPPFDQNLDETIKSISSFEGSILEKSPEKLKDVIVHFKISLLTLLVTTGFIVKMSLNQY